MPGRPSIDISLEGVGGNAKPGRTAQRSSIDIPLDGENRLHRGNLGAGAISDRELEIVNRHHAEIKALHRRALQGE